MDKYTNELITLESLPKAFVEFANGVNEKLKQLIGVGTENPNDKTEQFPELLNLKQAVEYLDIAPATLYGLVHRNEIPYRKAPNGRKLYFLKSELFTWITSNEKGGKANG